MKNFTLPAVLLFSAAALVSCSTDSEGIDDTSMPVLAKTTLFTGSNTSGKINMFDTSNMDNITNKSFQSSSRDSDGIQYDPINDCLFEASRSDKNVLVFENLNQQVSGAALAPSLRSDVQIENPRDIAISGDRIVVSSDAQNPGDKNRFYVYKSTPTSITLINIYETGYQHWGVFLDGDTLYAAMDNSARIAVYHNFFSRESGVIAADDVFRVEGAKSLRGITYDAMEDKLFLADVVNPLNDSDGAIHTIENFSVVYSGLEAFGMINAQNVKTIKGSSTMLGNPVDLQYDNTTKMLYAAERSTNGGMALAFNNFENGGNMTPKMKQSVSGISSIHLNVE